MLLVPILCETYYRTYLAAIHYNENSEKQHAVTKDGTPRYMPVHPKKSGGKIVVVKPVKENPTYGRYFILSA